ncbi:opsin-5-like [Ambystoma mexicanum]|uniref:opsin-5-like n=1 Tax=Ambystoma mexicanum TaxID=8296 RepID=UPI0037E7A2BF
MDPKFVSKLHPVVDYAAGAFLLLIGIMTVVGNLAVLATAIKRSSHLKSPELLTINLAITDLGMAISMYPLSIASAWSHSWIGGNASCIYYALMGFLFGVSSMMTLSVMAIVRYQVTASPRSNHCKIKKSIICISITFIWLFSLMWAIFPLMGWGHYSPEPYGISCTIAWDESQNSINDSSFICCIFILCTLLPAGTIILCYSCIAWKLHKVYQGIERSDRIPNSAKMERKLTLMAIFVSVGFLSAWTPYAAVSLWSIFHPSKYIPPVVALLPCLFAKSSTAYNPFIYYMFSKAFRQEIKQLQCCCGWRIHFFQPDTTVDNPTVSVIWPGRDTVLVSSAGKSHNLNATASLSE